MPPIWSTVILPIITSLAATGLVLLAVWLFDRKRRGDEHANQISHILNEISDVRNKMENSGDAHANQISHILNEISDIRNKMENGLERIFLETAKNEKFRDDIKEEFGTLREEFGTLQVDFQTLREEVKGDIRKISEQVSENRTMIAQLQEQVSENGAMIAQLQEQVSENRDMIYKLINVTENLQGIVENLQNIVRENLQRESQ